MKNYFEKNYFNIDNNDEDYELEDLTDIKSIKKDYEDR